MIKAVIFDLDGTLVDSEEVIVELFQRLFLEAGLTPPSPEAILKIKARGSAYIIASLLPEHLKGDAELERRLRERCAIISKSLLNKIKPTEGARETLEWLRKNNVKIGLVTNRGQSTNELLELIGFGRYFDVVITAYHSKNLKPHPEPILTALEKLGVDKSDAIYIGDSEVDYAAGEAVGIKTVLLNKEIKRLQDIRRWFDG